MKIIIILFALFLSNAQAFVLISKSYRLKDPKNTGVKISSEGCSGNGVSDSELKQAIEESVEMWNDVPESRLRLKEDGGSSASVNLTSLPGGIVIVGCGPLSAGIAGVTYPDEANGAARIILNSSVFNGNHSHEALFGTLAHELGHAIGLSHSKDPASVMTYEANGWSPGPTYLSQDDVDGVTYLYPNEKELGGLAPDCSSFASDGHPQEAFGLEFLAGLLMVIFIVRAWKRISRP